MRRASRIRILVAMALLQVPVRGEEVSKSSDEVREFILYTGANLKVIDGEELHSVVNVTDSGLSVEAGGQVTKLDFGDVGELWINREMKLNSVSATIGGMTKTGAFTQGISRVPIWGTIVGGGLSVESGSQESLEQGDVQDPFGLTVGRAISGSPSVSERPRASRESRVRAEGDFDAWKVSFELSAARPLSDLYVVLVTDYRDPARPHAVLRKFHLEMVDGISDQPRPITLLQSGFPPGFEIEDSDVYLYSNGREIPTNLSDKQVALTRDEAMQYLILEYMIGHKEATLAPRPMWVGMPPEVKALIRDSETNPLIQLDLDGKGRVVHLELDPDAEAAIAPEIIDAFRAFRFYPAFENGRPVEGTYSLRPKELLR